MHWIYLIHEFHNLSWITEMNELFLDIDWDAPVCVCVYVCVCVCVCVYGRVFNVCVGGSTISQTLDRLLYQYECISMSVLAWVY